MPKSRSTAHPELKTSRIPGFYRLPVEQRLAFLARTFRLTDRQIAQLRDGTALRIDHAVNMVENAVGVLGMPLGLGLNFLVDGREHLVPMAIEEASIIAAASKSALLIREAGDGFRTTVGDPVMTGQVQILDLDDAEAAAERVLLEKQAIIAEANRANARMVGRGGGVFDLETRILPGPGEPAMGGTAADASRRHATGRSPAGIGARMLVVHLLFDVREAMGANAVNTACEAVGPILESITGGRVHLRIVSNLADRRLASAEFTLPFSRLATAGLTGEQVAQRMVEAGHLAHVDPYRAATHNKGIFNGIGAAALALGQDWRAIEAGGHAYAARDGQYRSLTTYRIVNDALHARIELPLQVGWVGGAVNSHPGIRVLRKISGVRSARELASLLAAVGLGQNFAACMALSTVGIQKGHMALHARSVALSVGVPSEMVDRVAETMIHRGHVTVSVAEEVFREMQESKGDLAMRESLPVEVFAPGKVVLFGEHATVYNYPGITAAIDIGLSVRVLRDADGPRFLHPDFKQPFPITRSDQDIRLFSRAVDVALEMYGLQNERIGIQIESDLVPGMGIGSSAAFSAALCEALRRYKGLPRPAGWDTQLFEDAQRLEAIFHGHPSGMDAATVLSAGVLWFRKGPPREILPMRLPTSAAGIICLVEPGARTIEMVQRVQHRRAEEPRLVDGILEEIGTITVDAGIALGTGNFRQAGALMFRNHQLLSRLGVSTDRLDQAVELLRSHGVLGAKLTGSGGGGAVVALIEPETQHDLARTLADSFAMVFPFTLGASH